MKKKNLFNLLKIKLIWYNQCIKMDGKNAVLFYKFLFTLKKFGKGFGAFDFFAAHYA